MRLTILLYLILIHIWANTCYAYQSFEKGRVNFSKESQAVTVKGEEESLALIKRLLNDKFYDVAISECENFLRRYPLSVNISQAHVVLGQCYYQKGKFAQAIYEFNTVLERPQAILDREDALYWLGETYLKAGDLDNCLNSFEQFIQQYPDSRYIVFAYYSKGWALFNAGNYVQATEAFEKIVYDFKDNKLAPEALFKSAECLYKNNSFLRALSQLGVFLNRYPTSEFAPAAYYYLGQVQYQLGRLDDAIESFDRSIVISKNQQYMSLSLYAKAITYIKSGDMKKAF